MAEPKLLVETLLVPGDKWVKQYTTEDGLRESLVLPQFESFTKVVEQTGNEVLIEQWRGQKDSILQELLSRSRRLRVTGPCQVENVRNQNGRIYPSALWDRVLSEGSSFYKRLRERSVLGELEHPESGNTRLHGHNNLGLSHLVEDVHRKDGIIYATHLIFNTPAGLILREYFDNGVAVAVSSRGSGSTRTEGSDEIVEANDYVLDTFDFVYQPSVAVAVTRPVESLKTSNGSRIFLVAVEKKPMSNNLKESSDRVARARLVLEASGQYLSSGKTTLEGLLEHSQKVSDSLAGLGVITEAEFSTDVANLRGALSNRSEEINRVIRQMREAEQCDKKKKEEEPEKLPPKRESLLDADERHDRVLESAYRRHRELKERYDTAIKLGETLLTKARQTKKALESRIRSLQKQVVEHQRRTEASLRLMEALVRRYRREQVNRYVEGLVNRYPSLKSIEKQLGECKTIRQARSLVESIVVPLMKGKRDYPGDLPPLVEGRKPTKGPAREGTAKAANLMECLVRRLKQ